MLLIPPTKLQNESIQDGFFNPSDNPGLQTQFAKQQSFEDNQSFLAGVTNAVPAVLASIVDTFGTSLGLLEEEDVENFLNSNLPDVGQFYERNKGAVQFTGDLVGAFLPAGVAIKAVRTGGTFARFAEKTLGEKARFLTSTGKTNQTLSEEFLGREEIINTINKGVRRLDQTSAVSMSLKRAMIKRSVGDVVVESIAADLAIAATMHSSDVLFPDELSLIDHLVFFGAANTLVGGASFMIAKNTFNKTANRVLGPKAAKAQNPGKTPVGDIQTQLNNRGIGITTAAAKLRDNLEEQQGAIFSGDREALEVLQAEQAGLQQFMKQEFVRAAKDAPIRDVSKRVNLNNDSPEIRTLQEVGVNDPTAFHGLRSVESFEPGIGDTLEGGLTVSTSAKKLKFDEKVKQLKAVKNTAKRKTLQEEIQALRDELIDDLKTVPLIAEIDGTLSSGIGRKALFQDGDRRLINGPEGVTNVEIKELAFEASADLSGNIRFRSKDLKERKLADDADKLPEFEDQLPLTAKSFAKLPLHERSAVYDALQSASEKINPITVDKDLGINVENTAHYTKLDFLLKLLDRPDAGSFQKLIKGINVDKDSLEFRSLASKFDEFQDIVKQNADRLAKGKTDELTNPEEIVKLLNLPNNVQHPILQMFYGLVDNNINVKFTDFFGNLDGVKKGLKNYVGGTPEDELNAAIKFRGNMMNLARDRKPVPILSRNTDNGIDSISRQQLLEENLNLRTKMFEELLTANESQFARSMANIVQTNPELVQTLKNALPNLIGGLEPSGKIMSQLVQRNFRLRGIPGFAEADAISDLFDKVRDANISKLLDKGLGTPVAPKDAFNKILERQAQGDLVTFFAFRTSLGKGWDIKEAPVEVAEEVGGGQFQFILKNNERNRAIWQQLFKNEMPENARLPMPGGGGEAVTITQKALDSANAMNSLSQQLLTEINTIRKARNLPPIARKEFHLLAPNLAGKHVVYLTDNAGNVRVAVPGATRQESQRLALKEVEAAGEELHMIDESTMERYYDARSRAFYELDDFSRPQSQTGQAKGTAFGTDIKVGADEFQAMVEQITRGFVDVDKQTRQLLFEPELNFLKLQKSAAGLEAKSSDSVFDLMGSTILGSKQTDLDSIPTKTLSTVESVYDQLMQRIFDTLPKNREAGKRIRKQQFAQVGKALSPEFNPFHDFNDFLSKTAQVQLPGELRKHAGTLNEITTALTIRIFDVGMGVINMVTLATTLPPVLKMMQRLPKETFDEQVSRIGAWGITTPNGIGEISPTRSVISGVHWMFSKEGQAFAKTAKEKGFFEQFAAEQVEIFGRTGEKFIPGLLRSVANKTSFITDKTEIGARAFSFMTFANMGKNLLGLSDEAAMVFANKQANNVIADFRPVNRPVVFRGAAGMPLGLFTTFMWNYLQRLYGIVENKAIPALINQTGLQTMLFGAESVPGVEQFINTFGNNYDGTTNLADRLNKSIGQDATSAFLNGSIASLTGVSVGPRAAIGLPLTQGVSTDSVPSIRLGKRAFKTAGKMVDSIKENEGIDSGRMAEILASSNLNKGLSNLIESELVLGRSLDLNDNVIEDTTATFIGRASRVAGFKPLIADELRQENRRNRATDRHQNALKQRLSGELKSKIRRGTLKGEDVEQALTNYVEAGGRAENFKRYFRGQLVKGNTNKLDQEITKAIKRSNDQNRVARLLFLGDQ